MIRHNRPLEPLPREGWLSRFVCDQVAQASSRGVNGRRLSDGGRRSRSLPTRAVWGRWGGYRFLFLISERVLTLAGKVARRTHVGDATPPGKPHGRCPRRWRSLLFCITTARCGTGRARERAIICYTWSRHVYRVLWLFHIVHPMTDEKSELHHPALPLSVA